MSFYSKDVIDEIRINNDIVDVIGQSVKLKSSGSSYVGLCPFHKEKTPSFHVYQDTQSYYCFGCGSGGNVIGFTMEYDNLSFVDAIKYLANRVNYDLPEVSFSKEIEEKRKLKQQLFDIHKIAARFYYDSLQSDKGKNALLYLDNREVNNSVRKVFGLGYAPIAKGALYKRLKEEGYEDDVIVKSGLVYKKDNNLFFDKFFNRLMFPIIDVYGNIIGFGGRILGEGQPKYLNSPETEIFNKSRNLYNLNLAKKTKIREFILVEGYMDAIALYQAGFKNVVASLGTAFNDNHAKILKAYADSAILLFDSDEAGVKAVLRAIPVLLEARINVKVLQVDNAKDPDEYIKKFGPSAFNDLLISAKSHILFQSEQIQKKYNLEALEDRIAFSKEIAKLMTTLNSTIEIDAYTKEISKLTNIDLVAIEKEVANMNNGIQPISLKSRNISINKNGIDEAKRNIISIAISKRSYYECIKKHLEPKELLDEFYIKILDIVYNLYEQDKDVNVEDVISFFETIEDQRKITSLFIKQVNFNESEVEKAINDIIKKIKNSYYDKQIDNLVNGEYSNSDLLMLMENKRKSNNLYISITNG